MRLHDTSVARYEVSAVRIDHFAYILGGIPRGSDQPFGALERYDLSTGRSTLLQALPVGIDHVGLAAYQGDLIAVGGNPTEGAFTGPTSAIADVYRYDTKGNTWSKLTTLPDGARGGAAVAVIGDALYVAGGARPRPGESTSDTVSSLEIFDLKRGTWSQGPNLPTARTHVGGVALGGYFYVLGGSSIAGFGGELLRTVERYDPRTSQWQKMPDMPRVHWAFGITTLGAKIVVLGGVGAGGLIPGLGGLAPQVDVFDPAHGRWSTLPGMRTARHHFAVVSMGNRLYSFEGSTTLTPATPSSLVEALDLPRPTSARPFLDVKATIDGARLGSANPFPTPPPSPSGPPSAPPPPSSGPPPTPTMSTMVDNMSSKALGQGAIVNVATIVGSTSDGRWTIFTSRGVLFAHVIETVQGTPTSIFISGTGTITGGTGRYKGAGGWLDADETPSQDFRSAAITLEGTIIYSR